MFRTKSSRDRAVFLASTPILAAALVASKVGPALWRALSELPKELRDQWDYLNRRTTENR